MTQALPEPVVGVAIDAETATLVHWHEGQSRIERLESATPVHHRSTGHVRERYGERHGGNGPRSAQEPHRLEHQRQFLDEVVAALPDHDLLIVGPDGMPGALASAVREADRHAVRAADRRVEVRPMVIPSEAQLVALIRDFAGAPPRRRLPTRGVITAES